MRVKPCVVIPVYNHGGTLRAVVQRALIFCPHVLVVDDGSTDGGPQSLADLPVKVVTQPQNQGKGRALLKAVQTLTQDEENFTHMLTLDADAQHYPEDIPHFINAMEDNPQAIIIGNRDFTAAHIPKSSRFGRAFSGFWMWVQTGRCVSDMQSGYRAYPLALFSAVRTGESGYAFEVEVLVRAAWAGWAICGIPIQVLYQEAGERISHFRAFYDNARMTWLNTRLTALACGRYARMGVQKLALYAKAVRKRGISPAQKEAQEHKQGWSSQSLGSQAQHEFFRVLVRGKAFFLAQMVLQGVVFYYTLLPSVRRRAMPYVQHRFGRHNSSWQNFLHVWKIYRQFGEVLLCRMLHTERQQGALKPTEEKCIARMQDVLSRGKGCIILAAHVGGWQSGLAALERWEIPVGLVLWRDPKDVDKHYFEKKKKSYVQVINAATPLKAMVHIYATLKEGGLVLLMGDRRMDTVAMQGLEPCVTVPFLGENIQLPIKAYALASKTGAPLLVQFTVQEGQYTRLWCSREIVVPAGLNHRKPEEFLPYALQYVEELEKFVMEKPYQFFNFHNLWLEE